MQAQTLTPFQIFGNQVRYVVPMFQRPYVWNRVEQWDPLWEDVRTVAERLLDSLENPLPQTASDSPPHFLGAIVLDQQLVPAAYIPVRHIIDGQQRLTTLQLLLDAAQLVMQQHGGPADATALGQLVLNNAAIAQNADDVFKVWPTTADREAFRAVMDDSTPITADLAKSRVAEAHAFFVEAVTDWAEPSGDPDKTAARLHALAMTLLQYLKVVVIDLEPGDNSQVIFETLNHRGTPLLAADLVKNLVFQLAEAEGADVKRLYAEGWAPFDTEAWRRRVRQGRWYRPRIDTFLNYWLVMRTGREVPADRVFADFRAYAQHAELTATTLMDDFVLYARTYDELERMPWTSVEGMFAYRVLSVMEQYAWGPVLLWLFGQPEDLLPRDQRTRALRAIESWLVRRMVCRMTSKQVNRLVLELLTRLMRANPAVAGDLVVQFLSERTADSELWPGDAEVREAIRIEPLYRAITRARLRMLLEAIEDHLRTPMTEAAHCPQGDLTIEHVMPQAWREHWTLGAGDPELLAVIRDRVVHTLGNLTLVTGKLNPSLSNRPWTDTSAEGRGLGQKGKRSVLNDHSVLMLNKRLVDQWPELWNEDGISARAEHLSGLVVSIWPSKEVMVG